MTYIQSVQSGDPVQASEYNKLVDQGNDVFYNVRKTGRMYLRAENDEVWFKNIGSDLVEPGNIVEITGFANSRAPIDEMVATVNDGFVFQGHRPESVDGNFSQAIGFSDVTIRPGKIGKILLRGVAGVFVTCESGETVTTGKFAKIKSGENRPVYDEEKGEYFIVAASNTETTNGDVQAFCAVLPQNHNNNKSTVPVIKNVQIVKYAVSEASYETAAEVQDAKDAIDDAITALIASVAENRLPIQVCPFAPWASYLVDVECVGNDIKGVMRWEKEILIKEFQWVTSNDRTETENDMTEDFDIECVINVTS